MKRSVSVCLGDAGTPVGTLNFEAVGNRQSAAFAYSSAWLASPTRFALSPDLPLVSGFQYRANSRANPDQGQSAFFGCFADAEPDGWGRMVILRDHAKQRHEPPHDSAMQVPAGPLNDFDFLLWVNDFSRVGALRLQDANGMFLRPSGQKRDTPALIELPQILSASKAVEENRETARDLAYLRGNGTSLGGLRPKCSIIDVDGSLAIGKFPSVADTRSIVHGEVLALTLAAAAGINAAKARVVDAQGVSVAVIARFDRPNFHGKGGRLMYLSARSLMQATHATQHSYVDIADTIRTHSSQAGKDLEEIWRRMVFNILINNVDDHLNNHGFLHVAHDQWALAPAFDLNPFPDKARALKTWVSQEAGDAASVAQALAVARLFGLSASAASRVLGEVASAVKGWRAVARKIGMSAADIGRFAPAFDGP